MAAKTLNSLACLKAFAERAPNAAFEWIGRLESIADKEVVSIIQRVPERRMSNISKQFTLELLKENKNRILENRNK